MDRRDFLTRSSLVSLGGFGGFVSPPSLRMLDRLLSDAGNLTVEEMAQDEAFWMNIRKSFITTRDLVDLDNANTAPTPSPVFNAYVSR